MKVLVLPRAGPVSSTPKIDSLITRTPGAPKRWRCCHVLKKRAPPAMTSNARRHVRINEGFTSSPPPGAFREEPLDVESVSELYLRAANNLRRRERPAQKRK